MTQIGAHVSIADGVFNAPINAAKSGCEIFQIFSRSPRGGQAPKLTPKVVKLFNDNRKKFGYSQFYVHTPYYINLASTNPQIANGSINVIRADLERARLLGAAALMTHLGSAKDLSRNQAIKKVIIGLKKILKNYKGKTQFLIEISAGSGNIIGDDFEEISAILKGLKAGRYKLTAICFDTCHAFASGYDLRNGKAVKKTFQEFDKIIGLEKLKLIHANDSKTPLASHVDRHEHIGLGKIGEAGFKAIVKFAKKKSINMIIETPRDRKDVNDINVLKKMRSGRLNPVTPLSFNL